MIFRDYVIISPKPTSQYIIGSTHLIGNSTDCGVLHLFVSYSADSTVASG